jgi:hypothetical protein
MKNLSKIIVLALGFAVIGVLFFSMHGTAHAQSITLGNTINSQVEIVCGPASFLSNSAGYVCNSAHETAFNSDVKIIGSIPEGQTLIVTDLECYTVTDAPGENGICGLVNPTISFLPVVLAQAGALSGPHKQAYIQLHLTTGIAMNNFPDITINGTPQSATVQGYLIQTPVPAGS